MKPENCIEVKISTNYLNNNYFYCSNYQDINNNTFYTRDELNNIKKQIKNILDNKGDNKIGETLYMGKGSSVPRHKMKIFIEENKIKKTSIIEKSDTVIFDKKIIKDIYNWFNIKEEIKIAIIPFTAEICDYIIARNSKTLTSSSHGITTYIERYRKAFQQNKNLIFRYDQYENFPLELRKIMGNIKWKEYYEQSGYRVKNLQDVLDIIQNYSKNPHGNIIWDDYILEIINSEGIDLSEEYIDTLDSMFASKQSDNIRLAVEMLSNVNLEKFGLTVVLLLNKWKHVMSWGNGNTNNQAYKTLDRYFKNKGINWKDDYRPFSARLYKNYANNEEAKKTIVSFLLGNINGYLSELKNKDNGFIQINSINVELKSLK